MIILKKPVLIAGLEGSLSLSSEKFDFTDDHYSW